MIVVTVNVGPFGISVVTTMGAGIVKVEVSVRVTHRERGGGIGVELLRYATVVDRALTY
jgi:hypothetical protein